MVYFISGHGNFTQEEFDNFYVPKLQEALSNKESTFVVGDYWGVDCMAQEWLSNNLPLIEHGRVTVFHMFKNPRVCCSNYFNLSGGYMSDVERDSAMTRISDVDIAFIHNGRWTSGTAQNILRRREIGPAKSMTERKDLFETIMKVYRENELCMSEILASTSANGLSLEEAFELFIKLRNKADGDLFYVKYGDGDDIELIK